MVRPAVDFAADGIRRAVLRMNTATHLSMLALAVRNQASLVSNH